MFFKCIFLPSSGPPLVYIRSLKSASRNILHTLTLFPIGLEITWQYSWTLQIILNVHTV